MPATKSRRSPRSTRRRRRASSQFSQEPFLHIMQTATGKYSANSTSHSGQDPLARRDKSTAFRARATTIDQSDTDADDLAEGGEHRHRDPGQRIARPCKGDVEADQQTAQREEHAKTNDRGPLGPVALCLRIPERHLHAVPFAGRASIRDNRQRVARMQVAVAARSTARGLDCARRSMRLLCRPPPGRTRIGPGRHPRSRYRVSVQVENGKFQADERVGLAIDRIPGIGEFEPPTCPQQQTRNDVESFAFAIMRSVSLSSWQPSFSLPPRVRSAQGTSSSGCNSYRSPARSSARPQTDPGLQAAVRASIPDSSTTTDAGVHGRTAP